MSTISGSSRARTALPAPARACCGHSRPTARRGADLARHGTGQRSGLIRGRARHHALADPFTGCRRTTHINNTGKVIGYSENSVGGTSVASPLVGALWPTPSSTRTVRIPQPGALHAGRTSALHDVRRSRARMPARYHGVACDVAMCGSLWLHHVRRRELVHDRPTPARSQGKATTPCPGSQPERGSPSSTGLREIPPARTVISRWSGWPDAVLSRGTPPDPSKDIGPAGQRGDHVVLAADLAQAVDEGLPVRAADPGHGVVALPCDLAV